jgi:DNA invertase Pin-like site-specific DNA recombinase
LLNVLAAIGERGAGFRSLKDAWAETTTPHGKLMVTVRGGLAEFERELIRARTGEGRKGAWLIYGASTAEKPCARPLPDPGGLLGRHTRRQPDRRQGLAPNCRPPID